MKKLSIYFFAVLACLLVFTSCEKDDDKELQISFNNVNLNEDGYQDNFTTGLNINEVDFYNKYSVSEYEGVTYTFWAGFAVSKLNDTETPGYDNQFSVYTPGKANGDNKFAVVFAAFDTITSCRFAEEGVERKFKSLKICNSTYTALTMKNGGYPATAFADGSWFKIIMTGVKANGDKAGKIEYYLGDFRDGKTFICSEWTNVNLSALGNINAIEFTFESSDVHPVNGINTPQYACIDDIIIEE